MARVSEQCCPYGSHRAEGRLPQSAPRLDATMEVRPCELLIDVEMLNLDSTSMNQIAESSGHDPERIKLRIRDIVATRGPGKDVELLVGNGYVANCVEDAFNIVREHPELRREIDFRCAAGS